MKLYRIRDKNTGLFFVNVPRFHWGEDASVDDAQWSESGSFYKNFSPIERWLMFLSGSIVRRETMYSEKCVFIVKLGFQKKMDRYEVVVTDVTVKSTKRIPARKFIGDLQKVSAK